MTQKKDVKTRLEEVANSQKEHLESGHVLKLREGDPDFFTLSKIDYGFGKRNVFIKKEQKDYELLQGARGGSVPLDGSSHEALIQAVELKIDEKDKIRIDEIDYVTEVLGIQFKKGAGFSELGFRTPRLLNFYKKRGMKVSGYDVLEINILSATELGYDVQRYDFNDCDDHLQISDSDLVVSYHMLEHLSDPLKAVKKIYSSMKPGAYFHVEVPIEPGIPNIRYGHMFPFEPADLGRMLDMSGFVTLTASNNTHKGGGSVERYFALKPDMNDNE